MSKSSTSHILRVEYDNQTHKDNAVHIIFIRLYESTAGTGHGEEQLLCHPGALNPPEGITLIS